MSLIKRGISVEFAIELCRTCLIGLSLRNLYIRDGDQAGHMIQPGLVMSGGTSTERGGQDAARRSEEDDSDPRLDWASRLWRGAIDSLSRLVCLNNSASAHRSALQVALCFAGFALVWIFGGDYLLHTLVADQQQAASLQTVKGIAFVLLTSGVIFLLVRHQMAEALSANATLRESVERLGFVTEQAKVGYWHWDIVTDTFEWSPVGKRLLGIPADDVMSLERFHAALHADDRARVAGAMSACLSGSSSPDYHFEFRTVWPDGSVRWIEAIGSTTFEGGVAKRMAGISFDITERRQAEMALRESVERLRFVTEHAKVGYWHWDVATDAAYWSPVCKLLYGVPVDQEVTYEKISGGNPSG